MSRRRAAALVLAVLATGCTAGSQDLPPAREGRSGLQGSGTLDGRQVAVSAGLVDLVVGDCDPVDGDDEDLCFISETIDGRTFVIAVENPAVLAEGETVDVIDTPCADPDACDALTGGAAVTLKLETDDPVRATGGTITLDRLIAFTNYVGRFELTLPQGRFGGTFDVVPRPE